MKRGANGERLSLNIQIFRFIAFIKNLVDKTETAPSRDRLVISLSHRRSTAPTADCFVFPSLPNLSFTIRCLGREGGSQKARSPTRQRSTFLWNRRSCAFAPVLIRFFFSASFSLQSSPIGLCGHWLCARACRESSL